MTWPTIPLPTQARALLLLPAGLRAFDEDFVVDFPVPAFIDVESDRYTCMHVHHGAEVDRETRALYVLGGRYLPYGAGTLRLDPDEARDQ